MTSSLFSRLLFLLSAGLLALAMSSPVLAQSQQSDVGGSQISDVSGAAVFSDQPIQFRDPEIRRSVENVAASLSQSLQRGQIATASGPMDVPPALAMLLTKSTDTAMQTAVLNAFLNDKLPEAEAQALTAALAELLAGSTVDARQFEQAVRAFNLIVETAPNAFIANPPAEFVVTREVLSTMLQAATR